MKLKYWFYRNKKEYIRILWFKIRKEISPYENHGVIPAIGGNFKDYIMSNNMPVAIEKLKDGLDTVSKKHIDFCIKAIADFPSFEYSDFFANKKIAEYYPDFIKTEAEACEIGNKKLWDQGLLGGYETCYYQHGLKLLPKSVIQYAAKDKIFFDLGSWDGDSAMSLALSNPAKILSFDISKKNLEKAKKNTKGLPVEHFNMALSDKSGTMNFDDNGTWSDTVVYGGKDTVKVETLDNFMSNRTETVGLIKADIEGQEMAMLHGAVETIKRDKPVISVSIYHDPISFFEIKPFLESLNLGYKFIIRVLGFYEAGPINETTLIAYPEI